MTIYFFIFLSSLTFTLSPLKNETLNNDDDDCCWSWISNFAFNVGTGIFYTRQTFRNRRSRILFLLFWREPVSAQTRLSNRRYQQSWRALSRRRSEINNSSGPSGKLLRLLQPKHLDASHAWQHSIFVGILGRSGCSSPSTLPRAPCINAVVSRDQHCRISSQCFTGPDAWFHWHLPPQNTRRREMQTSPLLKWLPA